MSDVEMRPWCLLAFLSTLQAVSWSQAPPAKRAFTMVSSPCPDALAASARDRCNFHLAGQTVEMSGVFLWTRSFFVPFQTTRGLSGLLIRQISRESELQE